MNPNWLILEFSICIFFTRKMLSWFIFSHSAAELNLGQPELVNAAFRTPWGMLFRQKGKEKIPGHCANSAHSATLFKLLWLCVSKKILWLMVLDRIHGCVMKSVLIWILFWFEWSCSALTNVVFHFLFKQAEQSRAKAIVDSHTWSFSVSCTKNASPLSPSFICRSTGSPLISISTWTTEERGKSRGRTDTSNVMLCPCFSSPYHFLSGPEDTHLAEADVERRALQGPIRLPHHNDINAARKGGRVESSVQLLDLDKHLAR